MLGPTLLPWQPDYSTSQVWFGSECDCSEDQWHVPSVILNKYHRGSCALSEIFTSALPYLWYPQERFDETSTLIGVSPKIRSHKVCKRSAQTKLVFYVRGFPSDFPSLSRPSSAISNHVPPELSFTWQNALPLRTSFHLGDPSALRRKGVVSMTHPTKHRVRRSTDEIRQERKTSLSLHRSVHQSGIKGERSSVYTGTLIYSGCLHSPSLNKVQPQFEESLPARRRP